MLAVLGPQVGAGPSCKAIVKPDRVCTRWLAHSGWSTCSSRCAAGQASRAR